MISLQSLHKNPQSKKLLLILACACMTLTGCLGQGQRGSSAPETEAAVIEGFRETESPAAAETTAMTESASIGETSENTGTVIMAEQTDIPNEDVEFDD